MTSRRPALDAVVVGAGLMGRWHAHEIRRVGGRVQAVVDSDLERARGLANRCQAAVPFGELEEAVAAVPADAVHVCTPTASHAAVTERALDAGLHVLVEKPLAPDAGTTARLLDRAESRGLVLCPVHQFPFQRGARRLFDRLHELAPVRHVDFVACSAGAQGEAAASDVAREILPHPLSLLDRLAPDGLEGLAWSAVEVLPGEVRATARADGFSASILISMAGRPRENGLRVVGEGGSARLNLYHGYAVFSPAGRPSRLRKATSPFSRAGRELAAAAGNLTVRGLRWQPAYPGLRELIGGLYDALSRGEPSPISAGETRRVSEARDELLGRLDGREGSPGDP